MNTNVAISLSNPALDLNTNVLILEQEEYSDYVGKLSKADVALGVFGFINPELTKFSSNCGGEDGQYKTVFYVYLYEQNLNYILDSSDGALGEKFIEEIDYSQTVKCSLKDYVAFDYPYSGMVDEPEWVGPTYEPDGTARAQPPSYTLTTEGVYFHETVYGSLRVKYRVLRHRYIFTMAKINDGTVDSYYAVVFARWSGGIKGIEAEAPYGFEYTDGVCQNGNVSFTTGGDPQAPTITGQDETIHIDYCAQEEK